MAYYKVRIEVWCDWNPTESDLEEIAQGMALGGFLSDGSFSIRGPKRVCRY